MTGHYNETAAEFWGNLRHPQVEPIDGDINYQIFYENESPNENKI